MDTPKKQDRFVVDIELSVWVYPLNAEDATTAMEAERDIRETMRPDLEEIRSFYEDLINGRSLRIPSFLNRERRRERLRSCKSWTRPIWP